jgi:hypothetical protein
MLIGVVPAGTLGTPDVDLRATAGIIVQAAQPDDHGRFLHPLGHEMRTATGAEVTPFSWRGLIVLQKLFTSGPAKMLPQHRGRGRKGTPMGLSTFPTVAVDNARCQLIGLITNLSTETASFHIFLHRQKCRDLTIASPC